MQKNVGSLVIRWRNKNRNKPSSLEGIIYWALKFLYHFVLKTIEVGITMHSGQSH